MPEQIMKILLEELKIARLVCQTKDCGTVIELPLAKLNGLPTRCPSCNMDFFNPRSDKNQADYVKELFVALHHLTFVNDRVKIEFILPESAAQR